MEKRGGEGADNTQPRRTEGRELGRRRARCGCGHQEPRTRLLVTMMTSSAMQDISLMVK